MIMSSWRLEGCSTLASQCIQQHEEESSRSMDTWKLTPLALSQRASRTLISSGVPLILLHCCDYVAQSLPRSQCRRDLDCIDFFAGKGAISRLSVNRAAQLTSLMWSTWGMTVTYVTSYPRLAFSRRPALWPVDLGEESQDCMKSYQVLPSDLNLGVLF